MADKKINHEEFLNKIRRDPDAAVAKQILLPSSATCAIISKRMLGIFDHLDQMQLAVETLNTIKYIAEHDYLAYLMFLNRFDLIREIFWEKELFGQQLALLDKLEKEKEQEKNQQVIMDEQARHSLFNKQQQEQLAREQEQRVKEENALINMELYSYFVHLHHEIYNNFHIKQIQILDIAYQGRVARINRAITIAHSDPSIAFEDREALSNLLRNYQEEYNAANQMTINKPDGSIDPDALMRQSEAKKRIEDKYRPLFAPILTKYESLIGISQAESEAIFRTQDELESNETVRDEQLKVNKELLEGLRQGAKATLSESMRKSITLLESFDANRLQEMQRTEFQRSLENLIECRAKLNQTQDDRQIKDLTNVFSKELLLLKEIVKPQMDESIFKKFDDESRKLSELNNITKFSASLSSTAAPLSVSPLSHVQMVENDCSPASDEMVADEPLQYEENHSIKHTGQSTVSFRDRMLSIRIEQEQQQNEDIVLDVQNTQEDPEEERVIELNEEQQDNLDEVITELLENAENIAEDSASSPEEKRMALQLKQFGEEIRSTIDGTVEISKLELLKNNLDLLNEKYTELSEFSRNLNLIMESFEFNRRPRM